MKNVRGFTLVELIITLAVMAIALALAIPSFQTLFENNRTTTQANELVAAMNLARSEAIRIGASVSVEAAPGGFQNGWCVHVGAGCGTIDELRTFPAMNQITIDSLGETLITFDARGVKTLPVAQVNITLSPSSCPPGDMNRARAININNTGRLSITRINCP
ncbi:MAG: pilus assembly protein [Gammaproteobacteria bacterium HGW-Gammaproteobacteria-1]|jgi:type IV fimbrial biogenesis protein FimT|nr:MAG: pilus assembly protein [Gammaproteobacteria bacterium HGW-Gammaproteobacteria-1]